MSNFNVVNVIIPAWINLYTYQSCIKNLSIGDLVEIPLRNKNIYGVIFSYADLKKNIKLKSVKSCIFKQFLNQEILTFIQKVSIYYMAPIGAVLQMVMSGFNMNMINYHSKHKEIIPDTLFLTKSQHAILKKMKSGGVGVIEGITGSGKTYIYLEKIRQILLSGKSVLLLVPEIALIVPLMARCVKLGFSPVAWHSSMSVKKRNISYLDIYYGRVHFIIGTRSALFLPIKNLSLIVVDEEHDSGYKQEEGVCYHARDMAVWRGQLSQADVLLVSATPSMETCFNVARGRYHYYQLNQRYGNAQVPKVQIIDMKHYSPKKGFFISAPLIHAISDKLKKHEQSLLFLNKRGYAPLIFCKSCDYRMTCPSCSVSLVGHISSNSLKCHYCHYTIIWPKICPVCFSDSLQAYGPGAERIMEEIVSLFPNARVHLATSDILSTPNKVNSFIEKVEKGNIDIIVGTQIIAKGYHFPRLTLVGVIDMDFVFFGIDFRSLEKGYQMITQVLGRAGRDLLPGTVMLQTWEAHQVLLHKLHDRHLWMEKDIASRQFGNWPPFLHLARLIITNANKQKAKNQAQDVVQLLYKLRDVQSDYQGNQDQDQPFISLNKYYGFLLNHNFKKKKLIILGPAESSIFLMRKKYRYQILLKGFVSEIHTVLSIIIKIFPYIRIDMDPISYI